MKQKQFNVKRILKIIGNVIFYSFIVFLMVFSIANIKVKSEDKIANVFGIGMLSVQTDSMKGTFEAGDMLFVNMLSEDDFANLNEGDIVTFFDTSINAFNTHRIVIIDHENRELTTKADYNADHPGETIYADKSVSFDKVIAVYQGSMIAGFGAKLDYLQSSVGFALFVILPVLIVLIIEGVILARQIMANNRRKLEERYAIEREETAKHLELERKKLRDELLAELKKEKSISTT